MPLTKSEKFEKMQRLHTAHKMTKEMFEGKQIPRDMHAGTNIAQIWLFITAGYSGLEQTIKFLIAEENSLTINEVRRRYRTHNIERLFRELNDSTKNVVRDYYRRFQSLHSYITVESLDEFLTIVSNSDGKGYERWRYTLIEDEEQLPRNSAEALIAIWGVCTEIASERVDEDE